MASPEQPLAFRLWQPDSRPGAAGVRRKDDRPSALPVAPSSKCNVRAWPLRPDRSRGIESPRPNGRVAASAAIVRTRVPQPGSLSTSPSRDSSRSASPTGAMLIPSVLATPRRESRWPCCNCPAGIRSRIARYACRLGVSGTAVLISDRVCDDGFGFVLALFEQCHNMGGGRAGCQRSKSPT